VSDDPRPTRKQPQTAKGPRRVPAIEAVYKGAAMRSLFEVQFAKQLDARDIAWTYEPERLKGGRYLVDFHLPALKCWVEVKGRFEARDEMLLPMVARNLRTERGERLFLYMKTAAYRVTGQGFEPLTHEGFWAAIQDTTQSADDLKLPDRSKPRIRRPWQPE